MRFAGFAVAALVSLGSLPARADVTRAWTAAKAGLPADAKLVVGFDMVAFQKTQLYATLSPLLRDKPEIASALQAMKDACKIDPLTSVQGVVVAVASESSEGAVYVAFNGIDRSKLTSCLQAAQAKKDTKDVKLTIKQDGDVTQVTRGDETTFMGWVGKDVLVVPMKTQDKPSLVKWMGGKGALASSSLGKRLARTNTGATLWFAGDESKEIQPGVTVKGGYGALSFAKGNVDADIHGTTESKAQATSLAEGLSKQLDQARKTTEPLAGLLKQVTITAADADVVVKASMVEKDLVGFLKLAMMSMGK